MFLVLLLVSISLATCQYPAIQTMPYYPNQAQNYPSNGNYPGQGYNPNNRYMEQDDARDQLILQWLFANVPLYQRQTSQAQQQLIDIYTMDDIKDFQKDQMALDWARQYNVQNDYNNFHQQFLNNRMEVDDVEDDLLDEMPGLKMEANNLVKDNSLSQKDKFQRLDQALARSNNRSRKAATYLSLFNKQ